MVYETIDEWLEANTHQAHKIVERRVKNEEDKENLENTLIWCEREILQAHKMMHFLETAVKDVCTEEQHKQIQDLYSAFMHNDFVFNSPIGRELLKQGKIGVASAQFLLLPKGTDEED